MRKVSRTPSGCAAASPPSIGSAQTAAARAIANLTISTLLLSVVVLALDATLRQRVGGADVAPLIVVAAAGHAFVDQFVSGEIAGIDQLVPEAVSAAIRVIQAFRGFLRIV